MRDSVLAHEDVERSFGVHDGVEYGCWRVTGRGWTARLSSYWDLQFVGAPTLGPGSTQRNADELERFELFLDGDDDPVFEFHYRLDDSSQRIIACQRGRWERQFEVASFKSTVPAAEAKARVLALLAA